MKIGRSIPVMLILGMVAALLGACTSNATPTNAPTSTTTPSSAKGTVQVYVTDAPPKGVTAIEIRASNIEAHLTGAADDQWVSLLKDPPLFDLVKATGVNVLLGSSDIAVGNYTQVRLDIVNVTVTLDGQKVTATVPSDKLKLVGAIAVEQGKKTPISLDFDAEKSIVVAGKDKVSLKPVVKLLVARPGEALQTPVAGTTTPAAATPTSAVAPTATRAASTATPAGATVTPAAATATPATGTATPPPTASATAAQLSLNISAPADGSVVDTNTAVIRGQTLPEAVVTINDDSVDVSSDGSFSMQVTLDEGPNLFEIVAFDENGNEASADLVLSYVP